jgi:hypothetical protein
MLQTAGVLEYVEGLEATRARAGWVSLPGISIELAERVLEPSGARAWCGLFGQSMTRSIPSTG